jgi:ribonucleoside-diphosphate reductase alpha chain
VVPVVPVTSNASTNKPVEIKIESAAPQSAVGSSTELLEKISGIKSDAPLCMTCGVKMRASGACYVCEGCGNTSGCS